MLAVDFFVVVVVGLGLEIGFTATEVVVLGFGAALLVIVTTIFVVTFVVAAIVIFVVVVVGAAGTGNVEGSVAPHAGTAAGQADATSILSDAMSLIRGARAHIRTTLRYKDSTVWGCNLRSGNPESQQGRS